MLTLLAQVHNKSIKQNMMLKCLYFFLCIALIPAMFSFLKLGSVLHWYYIPVTLNCFLSCVGVNSFLIFLYHHPCEDHLVFALCRQMISYAACIF